VLAYDIIRPVVYLLAVIAFWRIAARRRASTNRHLVGIACALFAASIVLSILESSASRSQVVAIGGFTVSYAAARAVLDNLGLFAIITSLMALLTARLRRATEEAGRLAQVAASSADAIVGIDDSGRITAWNLGAEKVFGYLADEIVGRRIDALLPEEHRADLDSARERCLIEGSVRGLSWRMLDKGQQEKLAEITVSAVHDEDGAVVGTSLFIRDITERKELEQELLNASKMTAMGAMASGFVQEFSNLLTVMSSRAQMALSAKSLDDARAELAQLVLCVGRARDVTNNLLAYARRQKPSKTMGKLEDAADAAIAALEKDTERSKITVTRRYNSAPRTAFDMDQIVQVFVNTMTNSIDAMRDTGGAIEVSICRKHGYIEAAVHDNGPGISREKMPRLFEPFAEQEDSNEPRAGLGLFVCRQIIKFHDGNITVESRPGAGTTLRFYLPVTSMAEASAGEQETRIIDPSSFRAAIIDKDVMIRELLAQAMRRSGLVTETFQDAASARAAGVEKRFGAVFVDVSIRSSGDARFIEELKGNPRQLVIGMVGEAMEVEAMRALEKGLYRMLRKPFGLEEITSICDALKDSGCGKRAA